MRRGKLGIGIGIVVLLLVLVFGVGYYVVSTYTVTTVYVEGNVHYTEDEIKEIGAIRLSQDILAAQLASYYGSASDFERLSRLADECEEAASKGDVYKRIQTDMDFHMAITNISGNSFLINQQYAIYQQVHLIQVSQYTDVQQSLIQIHHHRPIIEAIRKGDLDETRSLICQHIKDFYRIDPYLLRCYGGTAVPSAS